MYSNSVLTPVNSFLVQSFGGQPFMAPPAFFTASSALLSRGQLVLGGPGSGNLAGSTASGGIILSSLPF